MKQIWRLLVSVVKRVIRFIIDLRKYSIRCPRNLGRRLHIWFGDTLLICHVDDYWDSLALFFIFLGAILILRHAGPLINVALELGTDV